MRVLTVPNWSFARETQLMRKFEVILEGSGVDVHYLQGDLDHNRTVSGFSGDWNVVSATLLALAEQAFQVIDLNRHMGVHPRIGALDVCPFLLDPADLSQLPLLLAEVEIFASKFAARFKIPCFLYEKSERGRHESDLPNLRKGGFGALLERDLNPDFGPTRAHPRLGATVLGVRDFLVAMNVNLRTPDPSLAKAIAKKIRDLRQEGDVKFLGVRALGFPLASRELSQVSLNLTLPDLTPIDPIVAWIEQEALKQDVGVAETELIGVIREKDAKQGGRLPIQQNQIVQGF